MNSNILSFRVPQVPLSYNRHFQIIYSFRKVELTREARQYKQTVKEHMPVWLPDRNSLFKITMSVHTDWYYKNRKLKKLDLPNMDKLLIDAIFEKLGIGDERLFECHYYKIQNPTHSYTDVLLEVLPSCVYSDSSTATS